VISKTARIWDDLSPSDPQFATEFVNRILRAAVDLNASDVHLDPRKTQWEVLLRVDGVLSLVGTIPISELTNPVTRLMVMAGLPTYLSGQPQEGSLTGVPADVEMRLGTFPTVHGPRAVIRLLGSKQSFSSVGELGLPADVTSDLMQICDSREGVVLMCGPAGSGKTTTLYACLREIAAAENRRSVLTIEDPVESLIDGISQSQLVPTAGMTLAAALRSAVRQDPEVLLVSEIRDEETADAVLGASLTGHLCFSSLHASDVSGAVRRLAKMSLPNYLLQSGLLAICSQRLLRRLCSDCRRDPQDLAAQDCATCAGIGYSGRIAIAQCARFDGDRIGEAIMSALDANQSVSQMQLAARGAGMMSLADRAWSLVESGVTDKREVYRVLGRHADAG
tara:strand:- start:9691 stop:10869 length:1179 start_codon:yes stop_codon:yes gene_type:complete